MTRSKTKGTVELLEEAVHLLRSAPLSLLATYYTGALPFVLAFLYFWTDMSSSPFATQHAVEAATGISLLYIWMKCWQSVFAAGIRNLISGSPSENYSMSRIFRLVVTQATLQPSAFILLPPAAIVLLPFGHVFAFYHNATLLGDGQEPDLKNVIQKSWRLANLWIMQNQALILILSLFGTVIFLNWALLLLLIPELIRMLFGIESRFSISGLSMLNTTFVAIAIGLTYLSLNPLTHTLYVLRCFYGESLQTGADLRAELKAVIAAEEERESSLRSA